MLEGPYGSFFLEPPEHQSSLWIGLVAELKQNIVDILTGLKDKSEFRATMVVLGAFLNILLLFQEIIAKEITLYNTGLSIAVIIPSLLAIFLGNRLHKKLSGNKFFLLANILLLISGLVCFFKA